jgi:hypothetical protein
MHGWVASLIFLNRYNPLQSSFFSHATLVEFIGA